MYEKHLSKYSNKSSNLVELGAGYGSKLFQLSCYDSLKHLKLIAGEFTDSGCKDRTSTTCLQVLCINVEVKAIATRDGKDKKESR